MVFVMGFPSSVQSADTASGGPAIESASFDEDVEFLRRHTPVVLLGKRAEGARLVVAPQWQGRVMTSSSGGAGSNGYGWINRELIASGRLQPHINAFGGEDRFWLGPEGGQFSIFFKQGDPFDLEHWQTPAAIDSQPYEVVEQEDESVSLCHRAELTNYSGTTFKILIERRIELIATDKVGEWLGIRPGDDVRTTAYRSVNRITNTGNNAWAADKGLLSIWILGMFKHSPESTVVIPVREGPEEQFGPAVNDAYFGKIPADRLRTAPGAVFFRADGRYRSKIGVNPRRARGILGSFDGLRNLLTIASCNQPKGAVDYVDSSWRIQGQPYRGDVLNAYNDGPPAPGAKPLGPFYELETSSPATPLSPGESITHEHRTIHFEGPDEALDALARSVLGAEIEQIRRAF
jgi:hypothetical protein